MNSNVDVIVFIYIFEDSMVPSKLKFPAIRNPWYIRGPQYSLHIATQDHHHKNKTIPQIYYIH